MPGRFQQAAAAVGVSIDNPNGELGRTDRFRLAMTTGGFTNITLHQATWHQPWPDADAAWHDTLQGVLGVPLRDIGPIALNQANCLAALSEADETAKTIHKACCLLTATEPRPRAAWPEGRPRPDRHVIRWASGR